ncbi:NrdH-like glutaredoxin [Gordonia phage Kudefre]|uniref:NrdH-like glutaredoxin n=1 Tax=Gordonia phage Kudefre TaxID=2885975 RepID=A0AAE8Y6A0_9CAUD|nr:NrdH-like glutaredoxin [Gordonia phage Kudefre]UDL15332.1 NrdH-like glutaredoxin [Gordonia phage Kudefre]
MGNTTLLSQPGCGSCVFVKRAFSEKNVPLEVVNIRVDADAFGWMQERELKSTPVLIYEDGTFTQNTEEMYQYAEANKQ